MADLTLSSLDSLLGVLGVAVKDQVSLLGGLEGDVQFIRDEMDSMNGFLLNLTKAKKPHDDSMRAWMKQVRDLTYVADDYIKLYMRDLTERPSRRDVGPYVRYLCKRLRTVKDRWELAGKIRELKERAREVGERRQRYGVTVPGGGDAESSSSMTPMAKLPNDEDNKEVFLRVLEKDSLRAQQPPPQDQGLVPKPFFQDAIAMLPYDLAADAKDAMDAIRDKLQSHVAADDDPLPKSDNAGEAKVPVNVALMKLLLRALYAYPYGTKEEVEGLCKNLQNKGADVEKLVMIFCYSKLSMHCKNCLQYLTTLEAEDCISRKCLVRRWLADGLVGRDTQQQGPQDSFEEAAERYFDDLVFRGFLCPLEVEDYRPTSLKLKSCLVHKLAKKFIPEISKSDNFLVELPAHFRRQLQIREMARQERTLTQQPRQQRRPLLRRKATLTGGAENKLLMRPMDEMVKLIKSLPKEYRLNVLDLGGCQGLGMHHLKSICKVHSLKYLSLRKTNVSQLPYDMDKLWQLETLDIRETTVATMSHIFLYGLKHLLAGNILFDGENEATASALALPRKLGSKTEILRYIQIKDSQAKDKLRKLIKPLNLLRKLGVVLNGSQDNITQLLLAITTRSDSLRSLSIWVTKPEHNKAGDGGNTGGKLELSLPSKLESLNLKCFNGSNIISGYIPQWINGHQKLSKITLRNSQLTGERLRQLGKLESLRCLRLLEESYIEPEVILKYNEFKELRFLRIDRVSNKTTKLAFEDGAATKLETVICNFHSMSVPVDHNSGIKIPPNLRELKINGKNFLEPSPSGTSFVLARSFNSGASY